jgi:hypothetical protein
METKSNESKNTMGNNRERLGTMEIETLTTIRSEREGWARESGRE